MSPIIDNEVPNTNPGADAPHTSSVAHVAAPLGPPITGSTLALRSNELRRVAVGLDLNVELTSVERQVHSRDAKAAPDALVEALAALAATQGGKIAGVAFDATEARQAVADLAAARSFRSDAQHLGSVVFDTAMIRRGNVGRLAVQALRVLEGYAATPEGAHVRAKARELRLLMRRAKARTKKPEVPIKPA